MIFNLWAVLVFIPIVLTGMAMKWLFPTLMDGPHTVWIFGAITFVIGAICEAFGMKGRLFFMPIWLVGLGLIGLEIGIFGVAIVIAIGIVLFVLAMRRNKAEEEAQWRKAQIAIADRNAAIAASPADFWKWIQNALFLPITVDLTAEMCRHNLMVLETITLRPRDLTPRESNPVYHATKHYMENQNAEKPKTLHYDIITQMNEIIGARIEGRASKLSV